VIEGSTEGIANPYTYTGRELDGSGLYYYRSRYYLPSTGRFLTPDPIGLEGGINPYVYVGSNPVNFTDPFGLAALRGGAATSDRGLPPNPPALSDYMGIFSIQVLRTVPFPVFGGPYEGGPKVAQSAIVDFAQRRVTLLDPVQYPSRVRGLSALLLGDEELGVPIWLPTGRMSGFVDPTHAAVNLGFAGANPFMRSPGIDTRAMIDVSISQSELMVSGRLSGDDFPDALISVEDARGQRRLVDLFSTRRGGGFLDGPLSLVIDDGLFFEFNRKIPLDTSGNFAE